MTPEQRVRALGTVLLQASCDCNTCVETRARLVAAFVVVERETSERALMAHAAAREGLVVGGAEVKAPVSRIGQEDDGW